MKLLSNHSPMLYAILDTQYVERDRMVAMCEDLISGGADLVQLRAKDLSTEQKIAYLSDLVPLFAHQNIPLIVNDDLEACMAFPNLGLHIGQDDMDPVLARQYLGGDRILGLSTHSLPQAQQAIELCKDNTLQYFAVGPIFETPTKPDYLAVGLSLLQEVASLNPPLPFFAIGGIKDYNLSDVVKHGGHHVVMVSALLQSDNPEWTVRSIKKQLHGLVGR
jgi:thiamine-phosphate pyrophosphorylase